MTYGDLATLVARVRRLVERANGDSVPVRMEWLTVEGNGRAFKIDRGASLAEIERLTEPSYEVWYYYEQLGGAISKVNMTLDDYRRKVSVSGSDADQVEAVMGVIARDLRARSTWAGGPWFRIWLTMAFTIAALGAVNYWGQRLRGVQRWYLLAVFALFAGAVYWIAWGNMLPGVGVYGVSASWIERHAPEIGFVGTALAVISLLAPAGRSMLRAAMEKRG